MKPFEIVASPDQTQLRVSGDISIQNAQECLEALRDFQGSGNRLVLDLGGVTGADVSFLQMICSLHRTCLRAGQNLTLKTKNMPEEFKAILEMAGYRRPKACTLGGDNPCLWSWRDEK
ncbi:MAG: STAS domain-containing protein [Deltaproteobacteria bacterium]|nr:STAS domain-containing protein [Deltaproteobacteria bacterium]